MIAVLVIDRDKTRLAAAAEVLARSGYCPLTARCHEEALSLLDRMPVGAVIAQGTEPGSADAAAVDVIRRRFPALPVATLGMCVAAPLLLHVVGACLQGEALAA